MCQWCLLGDELLRLSPWIQESLPLTCHKLFVSGLDGSGFAPCFSFHMIECVSVHEYANACYFLSHTIWKCQFWWWKSLISPRQANENSGQWDFSVIALRNSEKCFLQSNIKSWSKHSVKVTVWKLWMSVFPSNNLGWKWATTHELRNDGKESDKGDFQVVACSSFLFAPLATVWKNSAVTLLSKTRPKAASPQMVALMHCAVFWSLNMHNLQRQPS